MSTESPLMGDPQSVTPITPTTPIVAVATVKPRPSTQKLAAFAAGIALVAGSAGAVVAGLAFPPANGKVGPAGVTGHAGIAGVPGVAGVAGPAGSSAAAAIVDTNKLGYCFTTNNSSTNDGLTNIYYISSVELFAPTDNNGTLSCGVGSFISLTPESPAGTPVANYNATTPSG
jgi:hypothetical protein